MSIESVYNLNSDVKISKLFKDLDEEKIEKIEKAAKDGFSEDELQSLEDDGIDIDLIKENSKKSTKSLSDDDIKAKAKELIKKYCDDLEDYTGDKYKIDNPELKALDKALDDGLLKDLAKEGFTKNQIIDIISQAFPSTAIKNLSGGQYACPKGHGAEAKKVYDKFLNKLSSACGKESDKIKSKREELAKLNKEIRENNRALQNIQMNITMLQSDVEDTIDTLVDECEEIAEDQKEESKKTVKKALNEYINSDGEMTYDEFQKKLSSRLDNIANEADSDLSAIMLKMICAERKLATVNSYLNQIGTINKKNKELSSDAKEVSKELKDLIKDHEENPDKDDDSKRTDPIGFHSAQTRFDFFKDNDNNHDITNETEFLGAKSGFKELVDLDKDKDGIVTKSELEKENIKVVVTKSDGSQSIKNVSDVLTDNDSINLNSFTALNQELDNGNALIGTFDVTYKNKTLEDAGFQTLDTQDWLDENYDFSDEAAGIGRFAQNITKAETAKVSTSKINIFTEKNEKLEKQLDKAWTTLGFSVDEIGDSVADAAKKDGKQKGEAIEQKFDDIKRDDDDKDNWFFFNVDENDEELKKKKKEEDE